MAPVNDATLAAKGRGGGRALGKKGIILARQSQTRGDEVMEGTKNLSRGFRLSVPEELMKILRWHAHNLPEGPMRSVGYSFSRPSQAGSGVRWRSPSPSRTCAYISSSAKRITPKGMRRTFQDLARRAAVEGLVQRSICGRLTEEMTERNSSVGQVEVEAAMEKVVSLAGYRDLLGGASTGAEVVGTRGGVEKWCETRRCERGVKGGNLQPAASA